MIVVGPLVIPIRITVVVFQPGRRITNGRTGAPAAAAAPSAAARCQRDSPSAERLRPGSAMAAPAAIRRLVLKLHPTASNAPPATLAPLTYGKQGPTVGALLRVGARGRESSNARGGALRSIERASLVVMCDREPNCLSIYLSKREGTGAANRQRRDT